MEAYVPRARARIPIITRPGLLRERTQGITAEPCRTLFGNWKVFSSNGGITTRASNGLHYVSPAWSGLTLRAMYASGEADDLSRPSGDGDMYGLSGVYVSGPLTAQAYYQSREFDNGLNDTDRIDEHGVGAQYRFGACRVAASYGVADTELPGGGSVEHDA